MASAPPRAVTGATGLGTPGEASAEIRRRALRRLVTAVVLLAAAFGALLTYERFSAPRTVAPGAAPAPAPGPEATAALPPAAPAQLAEPQAADAASPGSAPEAPEAPAIEPALTGPALAPGRSTSATPRPPAGQVGAQRDVPAAAPDKEAPKAPPPPPRVINNERPVAAPPDGPIQAPRTAAAGRGEPGPVFRPATPQSAPAASTPAGKPDAQRGYIVQLGVFTSAQNAEALQRKLTSAGVATTTETRVLIGPFRDRVDAERSMEVVRKMGLDAVVMPSR